MADRGPAPLVTLTGRDLDVLVQVTQQAEGDRGGAEVAELARRLRAVRRWLTPRAAATGAPVALEPASLALLSELARDADPELARRLGAAGPTEPSPGGPGPGAVPRPGDRVRLTHPDGTTLDGRWVEVLRLDSGDLHACDADAGARVEVIPP